MTNQSWQKNFTQRCEYVGWRVDKTASNHFKVFDASGKLLLTFSGTPGDKRAMLNALSQAKRAGLEDLELQLKLRRERDRLARIEADRTANERASASLALAVFTAQPLAVTNGVARETNQRGRNQVSDQAPTVIGHLPDGRAIVARAKAKLTVPGATDPVVTSTVDELLLSTGEVVYQCVHPDAIPGATEPCTYVNELGGAVRAHQKAHGKTAHARHALALAKRAEAERDAATAALEEARRRKSEGARKGHENRRARNTADASAAAPAKAESSSAAGHLVSEIQRQLTGISLRVDRLASELGEVVSDLEKLRGAAADLPVVDPEVVDKAARWDAVRGLLS